MFLASHFDPFNGEFLLIVLPGEMLGLIFAGYVPLASQSLYPFIVYFLANYGAHLSHFLENVIFAIPAKSLSIYASTLSMWFQERSIMQSVQLIIKFNKQTLSDFFNRESSHFESLLAPKI